MSNKTLRSGFREGFLKKKHAVKKKIWRRRWFVLTNDALYYYTEKGELRGEILMKNVLKVENWEPTEDDKDLGLNFCFEVETKGEVNKKGKSESKYILQADDNASRDRWIYHLDVVAAVNFYANNPKLNTSRRFVQHCALILQTSASYVANSVHFSRNTFLRGDEAKILDINHQLSPPLFKLLEASMRYVVQRGEDNREAVALKAKEFEAFSLRVFNLWEYISQLDGVSAEAIRNIVMLTSDCVRAVHELALMDISSEVVTEDNTPISSPVNSPRGPTMSIAAADNWRRRPRSTAQSIASSPGPRSVDSSFLRSVENVVTAGKESVTSKPSTSWQPVSKAMLRKTKSEADNIGLEVDGDLSNNISLSVPTSDSEGSSPLNLSPIKEEEIEEAADVASKKRHSDTIFNLDLVEQVEHALSAIAEENNNSDGNGMPEIIVPTPRKKRSFVAKFEKPVLVDPSNQIDDCVRELTDMQFEIAKEEVHQNIENLTSPRWKSYSPFAANSKKPGDSVGSTSSRSSLIIVSDPNENQNGK